MSPVPNNQARMSPGKMMVGQPVADCNACEGGKLYRNPLMRQISCDTCTFILTSEDLMLGDRDRLAFQRLLDSRVAVAKRNWRESQRRQEAEADKLKRDEAKGKVKRKNKKKKDDWLTGGRQAEVFIDDPLADNPFARPMTTEETLRAARMQIEEETRSEKSDVQKTKDETPVWSKPGKRKVDF